MYHESADVLIVVTESLVVGQFKVEGDGGLSEISKVKMSTRYGLIIKYTSGYEPSLKILHQKGILNLKQSSYI